jgi:hypothetical protein
MVQANVIKVTFQNCVKKMFMGSSCLDPKLEHQATIEFTLRTVPMKLLKQLHQNV